MLGLNSPNIENMSNILFRFRWIDIVLYPNLYVDVDRRMLLPDSYGAVQNWNLPVAFILNRQANQSGTAVTRCISPDRLGLSNTGDVSSIIRWSTLVAVLLIGDRLKERRQCYRKVVCPLGVAWHWKWGLMYTYQTNSCELIRASALAHAFYDSQCYLLHPVTLTCLGLHLPTQVCLR